MSIAEALRGFSIETVLAYPAKSAPTKAVVDAAEKTSAFLAPLV
jgi:glyceraldehyde-3-phosphate dehydrogenase (NADP+)